ncbi:MAG TPA: serine hydrolase [Thermoanaerobaculia bacterium]|nr:serine hydrolase [Thermoanaerobaculia bacterium]
MNEFLASVAKSVAAEFADKGLTEDGLAITAVDLTSLASGSWRGDASYYPASVVKVFYLAYYEKLKESGKLKDTPELVRAVKDMITVSSNDATGFVVDSITGTTSGPELSGREWEQWKERREAVNRFFAERGYRNLNANQKTFCEDAYGREQAFRDGGKNRNRMTTEVVARLFREIAKGEIAGPAGTGEMLTLLSRDITPAKPFEDLELEDARLAGQRLPAGSRFWSKSGDAYDVHHLVARMVLPNGADFVLAVFTKGVKTVPGVIPRVYEKVGERFAALPMRLPPPAPRSQ